jgi:pimeloyl-ACP methyl ester carboxylesterase
MGAPIMGIVLTLILLVAVIVAGLVWFAGNTALKVEAAVPPCGQFMEIDGQRLHYIDTRGAGPAIVMIHGLGGTLWNYTYALVDKLSGEFRVIAVDRPGAGYSVRPDDAPAKLSAQADTLAKFMRALGLKQPLLVGHSLGGALSLAIALNHPDCAGALALIAPLTHAQDDVPEPFRGLVVYSPMLRKIIAWTLAIPMAIRRAPELLKIVFGPDAVPADYPTRGGGLLGLRPKSFYNTSSDLVAVNDDLPGMITRYGGLTIPLAMLFAKGDRILDYRRQGEAMKQKCPALDLVLLDEHGHMLPVTAPDRTADLIRRVAARLQLPIYRLVNSSE